MREMPMSRCLLAGFVAAMGLLALQVPASAETLRCRSVNGNVTCAGSGGVSCQTVDGKKVCVSGGGDVVQEFGGGDEGDGMTDDNLDEPAPRPPRRR